MVCKLKIKSSLENKVKELTEEALNLPLEAAQEVASNVNDMFKDKVVEFRGNTQEIKPGVEELFETNPDLADAVYEALMTKSKPDVILPIGTSGSGKSTFIKSLPQENLVVISPDDMRVEFTGDMNDKSKDKEIYEEAANRAIQAIEQGKQVVFDTTNLTRDKRLPFIEAIKKAIPTANIQYKLMELNPELAKQRIKAQLKRGENRAAVSDETIDRHAASYKQMLEDIKSEPISNFELTPQQKQQAKQLYSAYLDTIFPDSEVKDIVYHGTDKDDIEFIKNNIEGYFAKVKGGTPNAIFFSKDKAPKGSVYDRKYNIPVILNLKNSFIRNDKGDRDNYPENYKTTINNAEKNKYDGVQILNTNDNFDTDVFVVFDTNQIYKLGSKQDIEGFKKFVNNNNVDIKPGVEELFDSNPELANAVYQALGFETELSSVDNVIETDNKQDEKEKLNKRKELVLREINAIEELIRTNPNEITIYLASPYADDYQQVKYFDKSNWEQSTEKYKTSKVISKPSYLHSHLDEELQKRIKNLQIINSSLYYDVEKVNYSNIFKEGKSYSAVEVLKYISENKQDVLSSFATTLLKYSEKNNVEIKILEPDTTKKVGGSYFFARNKIEIYGGKNVTSRILIHEMVHSFSSVYIKNNPKSAPVLKLTSILKNIIDKKILKEYDNYQESNEDYATKDIHELLAEIISRPDVLAHLSLYDTNYNVIKDASKKETLLDQFIKILSDIFNFSKKEVETLSDLILFNARDIFEASTLSSEFNRNLITPQQKQQAQQQYSAYLDSKNYNKIYYHYTASDKKFDKFDKNKIGTNNLRNNSGVDTVSLVDNLKLAQAFGQFGLGVYSMSKEDIESFNDEYAKAHNNKIVFVGINNNDVNNGQIFKTELGNGFEINVENTEALDILGSKQDIEGFKEFVDSNDTINTAQLEREVTISDDLVDVYYENQVKLEGGAIDSSGNIIRLQKSDIKLQRTQNERIDALIEKFYSRQDDNSKLSNNLIDSFNNRVEDSIDVTERKIELMQNALNAVVLVDASIEESGMLLPANHPLTLKHGKPVIVINPKKLFSDTVIHEFGHLYIDLLGPQDGVVKEAINMLRGTDFYNQIAKQYPELSQNDLDKEVLATAIGLEGDKLFKRDLTALSTWQKIKNYILNKIAKIFGKSTNAIEQLATEMLRSNVRLTGAESFNTSILQKSKFIVDQSASNKQAAALEVFRKITSEFTKESIDGSNYYKNSKGEIFNNSVTRDVKGYKSSFNSTDKGSSDVRFDIDMYTKDNIMFMLSSPKIPKALASAMNDLVEGNISSEFYKEETDTDWFKAYSREINERNSGLAIVGSIMAKSMFEANLMSTFDLIMAKAQENQARMDQAPIAGNIIHDAIERYIKYKTPFPINVTDENDLLLNEIKKIIDNGIANGSVFLTEQILFSENRSVPGTADLIEVTADGEVRIYDYKTTNSFKQKDGKTDKSDNWLYVKPGYTYQLASYGSIIKQYGIQLAKDPYKIVAIELKYSGVTDANSDVKVTGVKTKNLTDKNTLTAMNKASDTIAKRYSSIEQLASITIKPEIQSLSDLSNRINNYISAYKKMTRNLSSELDDSAIKKIAEDLFKNKLESDLNTYVAKNNELVIKSYVDNIHSALATLENQKDNIGDFITAEYLQSLNYVLQVTAALKDIKNLLTENIDIEFEDKAELLRVIDSTLLIIDKNETYYKEKLQRSAIYSLAENSNLMQGLYAERYKIEARKNGIKDKNEVNIYVANELRKNDEKIRLKEVEYWTKQYEDGFADLRYIEYLMADPGMSKSQFVQLVKNVLDKTDNSIRHKMMETIPDITNWHKNLKFEKTGDPRKVWAKMLEHKKVLNAETGKTEDKLAGSVIPEFISDYRKLYLRYENGIVEAERVLRKLESKEKKTKKEEEEIASLKAKIAFSKKDRADKLKKESLKEGFTELRPNPDFQKLSTDEQEALRFIHKQLLDADERLSSNPEKRLVKQLKDGSYVFFLPRNRMSTIEASYDASGLLQREISRFQDFVRPPADEDQESITDGEYSEDNKTIKNNLDILGNELLEIPVYYRNRLENEDLQSYDIPTLLALNHETTITFQENKMAEADLFVIKESLNPKNNSKILKADSFTGKKVKDKLSNISQKSDTNYVYKAVKSSIDNRLYKRAYEGVYSKSNYSFIKGLEAVSTYASTVALAGNFMSALSTFSQGSIFRLVEASVGEHLNMNDWKIGTKKAWADSGEMIKDTQRFTPESKTNLLIKKFGLENQLKALTNKFVQDNFAKKNLDRDTLYAVTSMAEAMVTANLMYSLLNNIKVTNKQGEYIDSNGKVVKADKAMSLDEAYTVKDGKLELNKFVDYTTFNVTERFADKDNGDNTMAATEISRYIRSVYADLYGQYNQDMKSVMQRNIYGKLMMNLRGWLPRGAHKRFRGISSIFGSEFLTFEELRDEANLERRFYSQDQKQFQEGHYITTMRYITSVFKDMKRNQLALSAAMTGVKSTMTEHEIANLKRTQYELAAIVISAAISMFLAVLAKNTGEDDDDDKIYFAAYLAHRINNEMTTFVWPPAMLEMIANPASSISFLERVLRWINQLAGFSFDESGIDWNIDEEYERGSKKGENKFIMQSLGLIPGTVKFNQMKSALGLESTNTMEDSFKYAIRPK